ncbi:hypothetical protein F5884DRAFT_761442 [Xylogone sp. PMI_703]|nr:hypothetical protein F5884DRAFT_761442 [Xylogone sp. PMI_703]
MTTTEQQLSQALTAANLPAPSTQFLSPILQSRAAPLPALIATAKHRLLSADLTTQNLLHTSTLSFPPNLSDPGTKSLTLNAGDIPVQVLDIEDLSRSKWEQIEALEVEKNGEMTRGREIIRVAALGGDNEDAGTQPTATNNQPTAAATARSGGGGGGPYKLLLQDRSGQRVFGFELFRVEKIGYPPFMSIGCKIMLKRGCKVARGMVLLEPSTTVVLGGKIEGLDKSWREGREARLRVAVGNVVPNGA